MLSAQSGAVHTYSNGFPFIITPTDLLDNVTYDDILTSGQNYYGYNALILNAFEDTRYRKKFYERFVDNWSKAGMNVDYDDEVTVLDLKTKLSNKYIIALCGHGMRDSGRSFFILEDDDVTKAKTTSYTLDLMTGRVQILHYTSKGKSYNKYIVTEDFFTHYYNGGGLSGSFIFSESCTFMGSDDYGGYDASFANALISCSAEVVVGFENSVMADYSRKLMLCYFEELLDGKTAREALKIAKDSYGYNDYEYRKPSFIEFLFDRDAFDKMGATAFPHLVGNKDSVLTKELKNGDWESYDQIYTSIPCAWEYTGDARVLTQLGEIRPYDSKMAFLSTGIGANSGVNMSGTQGSNFYQIIRNTNKTMLEFSYDFISEEPMEYVGSGFDDKFEIQILDSYDNILYSKVLETINTSKWYAVSGVNFDGSDNTAYHTKWKTVSIDISPYQNDTIIIKFLVYDVGDSAYDSAVVLDNIICN